MSKKPSLLNPNIREGCYLAQTVSFLSGVFLDSADETLQIASELVKQQLEQAIGDGVDEYVINFLKASQEMFYAFTKEGAKESY